MGRFGGYGSVVDAIRGMQREGMTKSFAPLRAERNSSERATRAAASAPPTCGDIGQMKSEQIESTNELPRNEGNPCAGQRFKTYSCLVESPSPVETPLPKRSMQL